MSRTLKEWRQPICRIGVAAGLVAAHLFWVSVGLAKDAPQSAGDPPAAAAPEVDAATKKLSAANGLFQRGLYKFAGEEYKSFLDQNPAHAQATSARYALAFCSYKQGDYVAAIEPLRTVLKDPKFEERDEALTVLGYCQLAGKQFDAASATFAEMLAKYPQSKRAESAAVYQLQALYLGEKIKDAGAAAAQFIRRFPRSDEIPTALYFQALSERAGGQNDAAVVTLGRLLKDYPDSKYKLDAMLLLGQANETRGKPDEAIEQYRKLLAEAPESRKADAHYSLGLALYKTGAYAPAADELQTVSQRYPSSSYAKPAKLQAGLALLASGKPADARKILSAVERDDAERLVDARYGLAECDIAEKKFDSARVTLVALAKLQPAPANLPQILLDGAVCLMGLEKFQDAAAELAAFEIRYADSPQMPEALYRHAFALHRLEKFDESHALCQRLAKLPNSAITTPAAELDAENVFLLAQYPAARAAYSALVDASANDAKQFRFKLRLAQCEYFSGNFAKAADLLRPLIANGPLKPTEESGQAQFLLGDALLQQPGHAKEAADVLGQYVVSAVSGKGPSREARYKLSLALAQADDPEGALKALAPLIREPAEDPWVQRGLLQVGQLNYNKSKKPENAGAPVAAAAALNRLIAAQPVPDLRAPALYLLGWLDFDSKRYDAAAGQWKTVAELSPGTKLAADAEFQRAVALRQAGKIEEALAATDAFTAAHHEKGDMERASQLVSSALYDAAWSQREKKDESSAIETYRKLLKLQPAGALAPAARTELADLLYNDKKYAEATELLEAVNADKTAAEKVLGVAAYKLGWCYEKLEKPDKAAAAFAAFAIAHPDDPERTPSALLEAGAASADLGKFDQAEKSLVDLLKRFPKYRQAPVALLKLGEAQAEQLEFDASLKTYQQFLEGNPRSEFVYRAHFGAGWAMENLKKYDEARASYKKVIAASNGESAARAQFQIGETLLAEQKFEPAIKELLAVEDVYAYPKWSARALFEAGRAFEHLNQLDQAKVQYNQIVSKYQSLPEAKLAGQRLKSF